MLFIGLQSHGEGSRRGEEEEVDWGGRRCSTGLTVEEKSDIEQTAPSQRLAARRMAHSADNRSYDWIQENTRDTGC